MPAAPRDTDAGGWHDPRLDAMMNTDGTRWIIVCATQRSGSTLLCEDLRNNGLGYAEEHFLPFVNGDDTTSPREDVLEAVAAASRDEGGIASVKVMASYAGVLNARLRATSSDTQDEPLFGWLATMFEDPTWVWLTRRSKIRQAISRLLSEKRGVNHMLAREDALLRPGRSVIAGPGVRLANERVTVDEMIACCVDILRENELWERFFLENAITPIRVAYEELVKSVDYISLIANRVGRPMCELNADRALVRLSNEANEAAYQAFMAGEGMACPGSPWAVSSEEVAGAA